MKSAAAVMAITREPSDMCDNAALVRIGAVRSWVKANKGSAPPSACCRNRRCFRRDRPPRLRTASANEVSHSTVGRRRVSAFGLAACSHVIRALRASRVSVRALDWKKLTRSRSRASVSDARSASNSIVSNRGVVGIWLRRIATVFSAVSRTRSLIPGFAVSTMSIHGHKAVAKA